MTVGTAQAWQIYTGDGSTREFSYNWDMLPESSIVAMLDGVAISEFTYEWPKVIFDTAPADGTEVLIYRRNSPHQPEDYAAFRNFPSRKTMLSMDRAIMICQEIESGYVAGADLIREVRQYDAIIHSVRGENAQLLMWEGDQTTNTAPPPPPPPLTTLVSLAISGSSSVDEGDTSQYTATATWDDDSTTDVTNGCTWAVDRNASISLTGLLTAGLVDANTSVTVSASYTYNSVTKSDEKSVNIINATIPTPGGTIIWGGDTIISNATGTDDQVSRIDFRAGNGGGASGFCNAAYNFNNKLKFVRWLNREPVSLGEFYIRVRSAGTIDNILIRDYLLNSKSLNDIFEISDAYIRTTTTGLNAPVETTADVYVDICRDDGNGSPDLNWFTQRVQLTATRIQEIPPADSRTFESVWGQTFATFLTDPPNFIDVRIALYAKGLAIQLPFDAGEARSIAMAIKRTQDTTYPGTVLFTLSDKPYHWTAKTQKTFGLGGSISTGVNTGKTHTSSFFPAVPGQTVYLNIRWTGGGQGTIRTYLTSGLIS